MAAVALLALVGCATAQPPPELVAARRAYARASQSPEGQAVPDEVRKAQVALSTAEHAFKENPEDKVTRDLAYIAERKAQLAEAKGQILLSGKDLAAADKQYKQTLTDQKDQAKGQAALSEQQRRAEAAQHATQITEVQASADAEKAARINAEARNQALMNELAVLEQLREDTRGMVITLSGDVIFVTNEATLLPAAQARLDKVAGVIKPSTHRIVIEGHTDSRGKDGMNQELSHRRAGAVRDYLVSRGVSADRIQASGFGRMRPIADNKSAEGRAMNRRVEIVVEGMKMAQTGGGAR